MEIVNNEELLENYTSSHQLLEHFSICKPNFYLLHYCPGEMLTSPFMPSQYLQFIVAGDLLLYDMPSEDSSVALQTSHQGVRLIGDMELLEQKMIHCIKVLFQYHFGSFQSRILLRKLLPFYTLKGKQKELRLDLSVTCMCRDLRME